MIEKILQDLGGLVSAVGVLFTFLFLITLVLILIGLPTAQPKIDDSKEDK